MNRWERLGDPFGGYIEDLLSNVPPHCQRALDVGCGVGELTRLLATRSEEALGIDRAEHMIGVARQLAAEVPNVAFQIGDFLSAGLPDDTYDFVLSVASIHHMDFDLGLSRMAAVTRPGGVVAVLGLANESAPLDYITSALGAVQLHTLGRRSLGGTNVHNMPILDATMTYREVAERAQQLLPGVAYRRRPIFRYSLVWQKPGRRLAWFRGATADPPNRDRSTHVEEPAWPARACAEWSPQTGRSGDVVTDGGCDATTLNERWLLTEAREPVQPASCVPRLRTGRLLTARRQDRLRDAVPYGLGVDDVLPLGVFDAALDHHLWLQEHRIRRMYNRSRAVFAEALVCALLPNADIVEDPTAAWDIDWPQSQWDARIQVKCSGAYLPQHPEAPPTAASWTFQPPTKGFDPWTKAQLSGGHHCDLFVLARHEGRDVTAGWHFWAIRPEQINRTRDVRPSHLEAMGAHQASPSGLAEVARRQLAGPGSARPSAGGLVWRVDAKSLDDLEHSRVWRAWLAHCDSSSPAHEGALGIYGPDGVLGGVFEREFSDARSITERLMANHGGGVPAEVIRILVRLAARSAEPLGS